MTIYSQQYPYGVNNEFTFTPIYYVYIIFVWQNSTQFLSTRTACLNKYPIVSNVVTCLSLYIVSMEGELITKQLMQRCENIAYSIQLI